VLQGCCDWRAGVENGDGGLFGGCCYGGRGRLQRSVRLESSQLISYVHSEERLEHRNGRGCQVYRYWRLWELLVDNSLSYLVNVDMLIYYSHTLSEFLDSPLRMVMECPRRW
jgi:hypothetical protein